MFRLDVLRIELGEWVENCFLSPSKQDLLYLSVF